MPDSQAKIGADFSDFIKGSENAAKKIVDLGLKISGLSTAAKGVDVVTGALSGTVNVLGKLGLAAQGIEAIGKSAAAMGMGLLQGNAALEMTTVSFTTLLGSAQAANQEIQDLTKFAAATPFNLPGLETATQRLLAAGYASSEIIPLMTSLGDSISALGGSQDQLNSLVYVFGQLRNESKLNAGDLMQMANLGIPALQMLADYYHVTTGEIQQMITKGLIPGKEAATILADAMEKKYGGMMEAQSKTFSGMISNLQDWYSATLRTLTKPLFEPAKKALQTFLNFVQSPAGEQAVTTLTGYVQEGVDRITKLFNLLLPKVEPFVRHLIDAAQAIREKYTPAIDGLIPRLTSLWQTIEPIAAAVLKVTSAFNPFSIVLTALRGYLEGGVNGALKTLGERFNQIAAIVSEGLSGGLAAIQKYGPEFIAWVIPIGKQLLLKLQGVLSDVFKWIEFQAPGILDRLKSWATSFVDWVIPIAGSLIQKLGAVLTVIFNWIEAHADEILDQLATWAEALAGWILPMIPQIIESLTNVLNKIVLWVATKAPAVLTALLKWGLQFVNWIKPQIGKIMSSLQQLISVLLNWIAQNAPTILNELLSWAKSFLVWIDPLIPVLINALARIISSVVNWISGNAPTILTMVLTWADQFVVAFGTLIPGLLQALGVIIKTIANWIFANGPAILEMLVSWAVQFLDWAMGLFDALAPGLNMFLNRILTWLVANGPMLLSKLWGWIEESINIVAKLFDYISPVLIKLVGMFGNWIATHAQEILDKLWSFLRLGINIATELMQYIIPVLFDIINQIGNWIGLNAPNILSTFWSFFKTAINAATQLLPLIEPTLRDIISSIGGWVRDNAPGILSTFWGFFRTAINVAKDLLPLIEPTLKDIITSIGGWVRDNAHDILTTFWGFFKTALNVAKDLMPLIEPTLSDIIVGIAKWASDNAPDILDTFWSFFKQGVNLIQNVMDKLEPVLEALIVQMGNWIVTNADDITTQFFKFLTWAADNAEKLIVKFTPAIVKIIGAMGDAFVAHADTIIDGLAGAFMDSIKKNPQAWAAVGRFMLASMFGPLGIAGDVAFEYLQSKSQTAQIGGTYTDPSSNIISNALPKKASGDFNWRGGWVQIAEQGAELVRMANNSLMLATRPMIANLPAGSRIYNNRDTMGLFASMPASAQQISNMYATNNANRTWDYSQNSNQVNSNNPTYYINNQPASRWSFAQQMKWYGSR